MASRKSRAVDSRQVLNQQVSESQLQRDVLDMAQLYGWLAYHVYDSRRSGPDKGFPDLVLARDGRVIAAELKTEHGRVSPAQYGWAWALSALGAVECYTWRPRHWASGDIERVLSGSEHQKLGGAA